MVKESQSNGAEREAAETGPRTVPVERLPEALQNLVIKGLREGWTVEGVAEAVNSESSEYRVTPLAVENFFWSDARLWAERVVWKKKRVEEWRRSLGQAGSAEALLVDSLLMAGLTDLYQHPRRLRPKDAADAALRRETLRAREALLKVKTEREQLEKRLVTARVEHIQRQNELLTEQIRQLRQLAARDRTRLEPEVWRQIEHIYGLTLLPEIPKEESQSE